MKPNPMWSAFGTDAKKEIEGVSVIFFGSFRVKIARAGGRNEAFLTQHEIRTRPVRKALELNAVPKSKRDRIVHDVYLDAVIRSFETNVAPFNDAGEQESEDWKPVIVWEDGRELPASRENMLALFNALPDLFEQIVRESQDLSNFRKEELVAEAKNS